MIHGRLVAALLAAAVAGCVQPGIASAPAGRGVLALTFDDGPAPGGTDRVLDFLRERGARATFFLVGRNVERHPGCARRIVAEGHEVGNHTMSHLYSWAFWPGTTLAREIEEGEDAIAKATGVRPRLLRWPVGVPFPNVARVERAAADRDCVLVAYSGAARDAGSDEAHEALAARVLDAARDGAILVMHDGHSGYEHPDQSATLAALPRILDGLAARGLRTVTVSELLAVPAYRTDRAAGADVARASPPRPSEP
ncbi:MAG: polysaccharide deacetylase family protein [Planctomycetales bacterium]|nr:polysaccharide deacetylase family protein [Planctomycetales bacterium]